MILDVLRQYHGDGIYLEAFLASAVLVCFLCHKKKSDTGKKIIWGLVLSAVFIFNDLAYRVVGKLTDLTTYYRFFWIFPVTFLIAYVLVQGLFSQGFKKKFFAIAAFLACIAVGGNLFLTKAKVQKPQNLYGLDDQAIAVAEAVMQDWTGEGHPVAAFDMYLEYQVRIYEPQIYWGISRPAYLDQAKNGYDYENGKYKYQQRVIAAVNEGLQEDAKALDRSLEHLEIDYLVIRIDFGMDGYLSQIGCLPIADCGAYRVYARR